LRREGILKQTPAIKAASKPDEEVAMNAIVANVLMGQVPKTQSDVGPLWMIALLCGGGLLISLCMASFGLDLGAGFF
jgi:hypothetical protein